MNLECQNCSLAGELEIFQHRVGRPEDLFSTGDIFTEYECPKCGALALPKSKITVYIGIVGNKYGTEVYMGTTEEERSRKLAEYCLEQGENYAGDPDAFLQVLQNVPASDSDIVEAFFADNEEQFVTLETDELEL